MNTDRLKPVSAGDKLSAARDAIMVELLNRGVTGRGVQEGANGTVVLPSGESSEVLLFELAAAMSRGGTASAYRIRYVGPGSPAGLVSGASVDGYVRRAGAANYTLTDLLEIGPSPPAPSTPEGGTTRTGPYGVAIQKDGLWVPVVFAPTAYWVEATVTADFASTDPTISVTSVVYYDGETPAVGITSVVNGVARFGVAGQKILAILDPVTSTYHLAWSDAPAIHFTVVENYFGTLWLIVGGGYVDDPNGNSLSPGTEGTAVFNPKTGNYEVVATNTHMGQASWIKFTASEAFGSLNATVNVTSVVYHNGSTPSSAVTTVKNTGWVGIVGQGGIALYDGLDGEYYISTMLPVEIEDVLTDFQVDEETMKLQTKSRSVMVWPTDDETAWTDEHEGTDECPPLGT